MSNRAPVHTVLESAQLPSAEIEAWLAADPPPNAEPHSLDADWRTAAAFLGQGQKLLERLPEPVARSPAEQAAATALHERQRSARIWFLRRQTDAVYGALTKDCGQFLRAADLLEAAAERFPLLTPSASQLAVEAGRPLKDKEGVEIDQGIFLWQVLARPRIGSHLVQAMLRPRDESIERLASFQRTGVCDLDVVRLRREGSVGVVWNCNSRYLNAEDAATNQAFEIAVDLVLLDPSIQVGVLRGATVDHPKYAGRNVFNAGLNLTELYDGKLPFLFYMTRDLGWVNKLYRGLTGDYFCPDEGETTLEKPWIAAVEAFAIGGGCQMLLVMDYVLAEDGAFFNLPARKEGIIPGAANLRLPRFVGDRMARQAILFGHEFQVGEADAAMLCDEVVSPGTMDDAVQRVSSGLTTSGLVSVAANRKAIRVGQESLDVFREYMSTYALEQAYCHLSQALVNNLEQYWLGRARGEAR